jgi:hypothetical protein
MSITNKSIAVKIAIGLIGLAFLFSFAFAAPVKAQSVEDLTKQINDLLSLITTLQAQLAALQGGAPVAAVGVCPYAWTSNLTNGSTGNDVMKLQQFLNSDPATSLGTSGAGSPGNESTYFGSITKAGVVKFQNKYASEVLAPVGLSAGTGYFYDTYNANYTYSAGRDRFDRFKHDTAYSNTCA